MDELTTQASLLNSKHKKEMSTKVDELRVINQLKLEKNLACIQGIQSKVSEIITVMLYLPLENDCYIDLSFQSENSLNTPGLNISTGHWTMSGKKSSNVRRKLLPNGHSCLV